MTGFFKVCYNSPVMEFFRKNMPILTFGILLFAFIAYIETRTSGVKIDLSARISGVKTELSARMDRMETRIEGRMDSLETHMERLETRIETRMDRLDARIDHLGTRMDSLSGKLDQLIRLQTTGLRHKKNRFPPSAGKIL